MFKSIILWIQTHIIASAAIGVATVVVIVTPIVVVNMKSNENDKPITNQEQSTQIDKACDDGYTLNSNNECIKDEPITPEDAKEQVSEEPKKEESKKETKKEETTTKTEPKKEETKQEQQPTTPVPKEEPKKEEQPTTPVSKPNPLKKYCDHHVAGYQNDSEGICVVVQDPNSFMGNFGIAYPPREEFETEEEYNEAINDIENELRNQAKRSCAGKGLGWTNFEGDPFGYCTWDK